MSILETITPETTASEIAEYLRADGIPVGAVVEPMGENEDGYLEVAPDVRIEIGVGGLVQVAIKRKWMTVRSDFCRDGATLLARLAEMRVSWPDLVEPFPR